MIGAPEARAKDGLTWRTLTLGQRKTARRRSVLRGVALSWQD